MCWYRRFVFLAASEKLKIREIGTSNFLYLLSRPESGAPLLCFLKAALTDELFFVAPVWLGGN